MSVNKDNSQKFIITFESYGKEVSFYLPDSKDHIQKLIKREKDFYEREMLHDIRNRVSPGTVAIDVGANIGNHTIFFSKICEMKVIALEPLLDSYRILNRNIELNGQKDRVTVLRKAAGHLPGRGEPIIADPMNLGECYIQERPVGQVEIILLDDIKPAGDVSVIKIDVEGMEIEVLKGATKLIQDVQPLIYVEARNQDSFRKLNLLLSQLGYSSVLEFNWTPTFLFMPCKNSQQRFNVIIERLNQMQNVFKDDLKEIQDRTVNLERQIKDAGKHAHKLEARLANQLVEIKDQVKEVGEHTCKLDDKLENHNLKIEQQNGEVHKCIKEFEDKLTNHLLRAKQQDNSIGKRTPEVEHGFESQVLKLAQQSEETVGDVVFYDLLNLSWEGWRRNQKVRLNTGGHLDILQNRSTPGVRKDNVRVDPGSLYRFTVRGSFQVKNNKAFLRVTDPDYDLPLCPLIFFSGDGKVLERHVTFMTLGKTHRLNLEVLIMDPCEGDTCSMHTAELRKCSVAEAYPTTASSLGEEILASMASIPQREAMLRDTILSLYPAVSRIRVFLNNYDHVPEFLLQDKIEVCRSQDYGDNGDAGKFFWVDNDSKGYRLICDDDMVFPTDYVDRMIRKLKQYDNSVILGVHGILLKQPLKEYYDFHSRHVTNYESKCSQDFGVHVLGTGAVAYHASTVSLHRDDFMFRNMADIWFALESQRQQILMICVERPRNWLIINKGSEDTLNIYTHSTSQKKSALDSSIVQSQVVRKNHPFTIQVPRNTRPIRRKVMLGITTFNRRDYLQACLESFLKTRNLDYEWVVIIADDGSTDDTLEYLENLDFPHELHIIRNNRRYACGQTNTIFELSQKVSFDIGFKVDDDLVFKKKGWDDLYIEAMEKSGWQHLVYRNHKVYNELRQRDEPNFQYILATTDASGLCEALADVNMCYGTGPFYIFTPDIIKKVGYSDEANFPIRGQWHVDYHIRCCRAGFNDADHLYDASGSNEYLDVQNNIIDDYRCAIPWGEEYAKTKEPEELARRQKVMDDESRVYISLPEKIVPPRPTDINSFFDKIYVLNLDRRPDRLEKMKAQADKYGIDIHRFPAVDGMQEPHKSEWESYFQQELATHPEGIRKVDSPFKYNLDYDSDIARVAYLEKRNQKKAIQSPGAWGYLKTMIKVLEEAMEEDFDSILVLDDDCVFHKNINELFEKFIRQIPEEWKILQLGALQYHWDESWITWFTENVYRCNGCSLASHAVGIHHSAFPLLLNYCYRFDLPYDEGPLHKAKRIFSDQSFTFYPNLIIQNTVESDIKSSNVQQAEGQKSDNIYRWDLDNYDFQSP
jgi:FkbM family methyltransferase